MCFVLSRKQKAVWYVFGRQQKVLCFVRSRKQKVLGFVVGRQQNLPSADSGLTIWCPTKTLMFGLWKLRESNIYPV